jgi:hypothetical protein
LMPLERKPARSPSPASCSDQLRDRVDLLMVYPTL